MLIDNEVILMNVPFDNTYKNVFNIDNYSKDSFYNFLMSYYTQTKVQVINRAIKNEEIIELNIFGSYINFYQYNYCIVKCNNIYMFYFITDVISLNDNTDKPSCTLKIEYDYWHNNIENFRYMNGENIVSLGHRTRYYLDNDKNLRYNIYRGNNEPIVQKKLKNNDYKILFVRILVSQDDLNNFYCYTKIGGQTAFQSPNLEHAWKINTPKKNSNSFLYFPIGVYNKNTLSFEEYNIYFGQTLINLYKGSTLLKNTYIDKQQQKHIYFNKKPYINILSPLSSYIKSIEYTFNSPVNYHINTSTKEATIYSPYIGITYEDVQGATLLPFCIGCPEYVHFDDSDTVFYISNIADSSGYIFDYKNETDITVIDELIENFSVNTNPNNDDNFDDIEFHKYPFYYKYIYYNDKEYPFIPYQDNDFYKISIDYSSNTPLLTIYYNSNTESIKCLYGDYLNTTGQLAYSQNYTEDYMLRNGNQLQTSRYINVLSNSIKALKNGSFLPMLDVASNELSIQSMLSDYNNTPDSLYNSYFNDDNTRYMDTVYYGIAKYIDNINIDILKRNIYLYGYKIDELMNIFDDVRYWFDYKQTKNCLITTINKISIKEKRKIEEIFNNGVFIYHIHIKNNNYISDHLMCKDGSYNNIEINIAEE